jgi:DNA-directed RNA polymerase subunit M/transcription elongation factor TFIIS
VKPMSETRGMIRVYRCSRCNNIGYSRVSSQSDNCTCSLCSATISHSPSAVYVETPEQAQQQMKHMVMRSAFDKPGVKRGLGVKKRVFNIVLSLVETNRGRPVSREQVMQECNDAKIACEKARSFLDQLEEEGLILTDGSLLTVSGGDTA